MKNHITAQHQKTVLTVPIFLFLSLSFSITSQSQTSQNWLKVGQKSTNFYEIQKAFMQENAAKLANFRSNNNLADTLKSDNDEENEENREIIKYQRWAEWIEPRVQESKGDMTVIAQKEFEARSQYFNDNLNGVVGSSAAWTLIGPLAQASTTYGNGRVNNIRIDPSNPNILYACTPASQLFKSINGGISWTPISNGILASGVTDLGIDPITPTTLYALTGDGDQPIYNPFSAGVYKSTNGGTTWSPTGLNFNQNDYNGLTSIIIHPTNTNIIIVSGTQGIYRSINGGTTFTQTSTQATRDLVFKPNDPNIVFAGSKSGGVFLRSADGGVTWTQITSGLATTGADRYAVDVSPANANYVYLMATNSSADLLGFYRSTDAGLTFTTMSTTPNIPGGQGWYNLAVAADPLNQNTVYAAGIDAYKSLDGGVTWINLTRVYSGAAPNTHPDHHDLTFSGTSTLYTTNDGGVYKTTDAGATWSNISSNLSIAQLYGLGLSGTNPNLIVSGHQDNGTNMTTNLLNWKVIYGGDGMITFIDRTNDNIVYACYQNGGLAKSINGGVNFNSFTTGFSGGWWVTPFIQDPVTANVVYAAGDRVFKSTAGAAWVAISPDDVDFKSILWMDIARSNNQIIYAITNSFLYKTVDGGANWIKMTGLTDGQLAHIHIDVNDPNIIYASRYTYYGGAVSRSTDAGLTWSNWSTGLLNVPTNTVVTVIGKPGEVYCGTDLGVYYRNNASTSWAAYTTGFPPVPVRDLEIFYPTGKLRAATFGRGIWESPLNSTSCSVYATNTVYVNSLATGTNTGITWANAFTNLQTALDAARNCTNITQIFVAAGTYLPTTTTDRTVNFTLINGVTIYGGFPNTGSPTFAQRNLFTNKTILSGDIGVVGTITDNSYHVINNPNGTIITAVLDGFMIQFGNANVSTSSNNIGGGMLNISGSSGVCSPKIDNCIFVNNIASTNGGAVFNDGTTGNSSPVFTNCVFQKNSAVNGGAVYSDGSTSGISSPAFINCSFENNTATTNGSVLYAVSTTSTPGICLPDFKNCIFWNNLGVKTFFKINATITASYSFLEPTVTNYTNVLGNLTSTTTPFVATISDLHLNPCTSIALNAGSDLANISTKDLDGNLRKFGVIDMGAFEYQSKQVLLPTGTSNLTICNNTTASLTALCNGGLIKWYDALGTTLLFTGSPLNVLNLKTNKAYKVRCDDGTCLSNFVNVNVAVNSLPSTPNVVQNDITIASGDNLTLTALGCLSGVGNYLQWYKSVDSSLVSMPIAPTILTNYYAKCIETTNSVMCSGAKSETVIINVADVISIITGNWENSSTWNLGRVPYSTDFVIIGENHTVNVTTNGAIAKKVLYRNNAKISLGSEAVKLKLGN